MELRVIWKSPLLQASNLKLFSRNTFSTSLGLLNPELNTSSKLIEWIIVFFGKPLSCL